LDRWEETRQEEAEETESGKEAVQGGVGKAGVETEGEEKVAVELAQRAELVVSKEER
jgi:hypothetical protein